jgi:hypothetical protein
MHERARIERGLERSDDGTPLAVLHVRVPGANAPALRIDERFADRGIETSGRLIDLGATTARWGAPVGRLPEALLADAPLGSVGVCPTNFGWQRDAFLVDRGRLVVLREDRATLAGRAHLLGWSGGRWRSLEVELRDGAPRRADGAAARADLAVGLDVPAIVREGRPVARSEWIAHPRLLADLRNAFDFAHGRGTDLDPALWVELRKALPATGESARLLERGLGCRERRTLADPGRLRRLLDAAKLDHVRILDDGDASVVEIDGPLAATRLPLVGIGITRDGDLDLTAIDGRRAGAPGATIEELARLMADRGVVTGGLGSAGGDVAVVQRTEAGIEVLNTPSTSDATGRPITRRVPALLVVG